jgi:hypothetical protein
VNIANLYLKSNNPNAAYAYALDGLTIAKETNAKDALLMAHRALSEYYYKTKDFKNSLLQFKNYSDLRDTVLTMESLKQVNEMQAKYETEKKQKQIELLNKEKEKQAILTEAQNNKKNIIIYSIVFGLVIVLVFLVIVFNRFQITQKQKQIIEVKSKETEYQRQIIEDKNREVMASIRYAKRIQTSLLPTEKYIHKTINRLSNDCAEDVSKQ